ncbi:hypothetical protein LSTR_LSTR008943 [Laodelphax striatellus]|uniref:ferroxidase n=2 Tax=Laodelphax striatellus TaxID=195883 RepID=A0A482WQH7_LAOST|nr:hypothetical protein LSTR_LSTR008943 [Laodelphax striatellus]
MGKLLLSGLRMALTVTSRNMFRTTNSLGHCRNLTVLFQNKCVIPHQTSFLETSSASPSKPFSLPSRFNHSDSDSLTPVEYEEICNETLESLCMYFEELMENLPQLKGSDVVFGDGVLTVQFGEQHGTYVINRQSPNLQIWLSSPTSGPKRYDFLPSKQSWIYKHDNRSLHQLLQEEIAEIVGDNVVNFYGCAYSGTDSSQ